MFQVLKQITFCYGHRLIHYSGKCQHLHGHDAMAEIIIQSDSLNHQGMVVDFSEIKADVSSWIDQHLDHKMLLCKDDPIVKQLQAFGEPLFLLEGNPTAENIARIIFEQTGRMGHAVVEVRLWESPTSCAVYSKD